MALATGYPASRAPRRRRSEHRGLDLPDVVEPHSLAARVGVRAKVALEPGLRQTFSELVAGFEAQPQPTSS